MTSYNLKFAFTQAGLAALASAQEKVCVVKSVNGKVSNVSASKGHQYPFLPAGYFDQANSVSTKGYGIVNNYGESLTFGLTQTALVNGVQVDSELNATTVLNNQMAEYNPIVTLSVYVAASLNNGSVISSITGQSLTLTYTSDTSKTVHFDDNSSMFVEGEIPTN
ncbi:hypothetical protein DFA_11409 [Cavenderia fasciculata]|uniref:Uncharacterized protein n=1 Tax=Cavenderia fasciculata TaxID=261658 RepID=F4QCR6_CACFS|nr:uncharacterized protein DFA_11409 [Cavenderia fasciculata]EGG13648.1 hypothetical protein DFA_11409 [Cavenderia fasciculata]|eukprot:XP_004350352.1 hypothetical protein DFA_11409 [Cavenderia fasciculata]